VKVLLQMFS